MAGQGTVMVTVLACEKCGAPMYPGMKQGGFCCLYCGNFRPLAVTDEDFLPPVRFRHKPVEIVEGLLKLGHVTIEDSIFAPPPEEAQMDRLRPALEKIRERDPAALEAIGDDACLSLTCPKCGKPLKSRLTDNIFTCPHCGQKFGASDSIATGRFDAKLVIGQRYNLHGTCLPFRISREEAAKRLKALARRFPETGVPESPSEDLAAAFIPVSLADLRWKMKVRCERGLFEYYQECLDWAWPYLLTYDIYLLDEMAPWDYGELSVLKPAYLEGNVRLHAWENLGSWKARVPDWILWRMAPERLRAAFGIERAEILWVSRDLREHKYALPLLPVYYLERRDGDRILRVMVNGQTGKAAALTIDGRGAETLCTLLPEGWPRLSPERTILSPPIPVRYIRSPFLHQRLEFGDALQ